MLRRACLMICLCVAFAFGIAHAQDIDISRVASLSVDEQARWLDTAAQSGTLAALDDEQLAALFQAFDPLVMPRYLQRRKHEYASCEFTMKRRERSRIIPFASWASKASRIAFSKKAASSRKRVYRGQRISK
ncbi:Superfamily I DNA and RNA helicase [Candidatus Burkholderia humilis]|nr:Superfamily I DNA and RNA helicase [Candidatus Burkholderia humilis]